MIQNDLVLTAYGDRGFSYITAIPKRSSRSTIRSWAVADEDLLGVYGLCLWRRPNIEACRLETN